MSAEQSNEGTGSSSGIVRSANYKRRLKVKSIGDKKYQALIEVERGLSRKPVHLGYHPTLYLRGLFANRLDHSEFKCSYGLFDHFKEHHNIPFKKICRESKSVDTNGSEMSNCIKKF